MRFVICCQFPPPVNGLTTVNQQVTDLAIREAGRENVVLYNLASRKKGALFYADRLFRGCKIAVQLLLNARHYRRAAFYFSMSGGSGKLFEIMPWLVSALVFKRRFIHHHSYQYCYRFDVLTNFFQRVKTASIENIFLCNCHKTQFAALYRINTDKAYAVKNDFILKSTWQQQEAPINHFDEPVLVLGHLSNLTAEKGFYEVVNVFELLVKQQVPVRLSIAGPTADAAILTRITSLQQHYGSLVEYKGPLYGQAKAHWFGQVAFFLFPSSYSNETYPLVILEAIQAGAVPVATDLACLTEMLPAPLTFPAKEYAASAVAFIGTAASPTGRIAIARLRDELIHELRGSVEAAEKKMQELICSAAGLNEHM